MCFFFDFFLESFLLSCNVRLLSDSYRLFSTWFCFWSPTPRLRLNDQENNGSLISLDVFRFSAVNSAIYHGVNVIVIGQGSLEIINFPGRVAGEPAWIWYLSVHLVIGLAGLEQVDPLQSTIGTWYHLINLIGTGEESWDPSKLNYCFPEL